MQYYNKLKMTSDKIFINALMVSIVLHIFLLLPTPHIRSRTKPDIPEETEFVYQPERTVPIVSRRIVEKPIEKPVIPVQEEKPLQQQEKAGSQNKQAESAERVEPPKEVSANVLPVTNEPAKSEVSSDTSMLIADDKKDLSSEPIYLDYYNAVRGQIYKSAQANRPYYFMEGGVNLVFTLSRTGGLLSAGIAQERSTKNPILQRHALISIERAAPFSPFHESMKEQELTLRITISFEK